MKLKNKTVLFLGSSVTYGSAANGVSFADIMAETCGIKMIKEAVSGTTLADIDQTSYVSRLKKIDLNKTEEAIRFILEYVNSSFNCPIVFYTGTYFESKHYQQMIELLFALQKEYNFFILNLWGDPEMLSVSKADYERYMADPVHPNIVGYREWWTPKFIQFCESI